MTDTLQTQHDVPNDRLVDKQKRTRRNKGRLRGVATAAALAGLLGASIALPVGVWLGGKQLESPLVTTPVISADVVDVTASARRNSVAVTIQRHSTSGTEASTADTGRITWAAPLGTELNSGDKVATIEDRTVLGYTGDAPLWRDLKRGSKGADVTQLQKLLTDWGFYSAVADGDYGPSTVLAVTALNKSLGRVDLKGNFSLASVSWLGEVPLVVEEVTAPTGATYSAGGVLVKGPTKVAWLSVTGGDEDAIAAGKTQLKAATLTEPIDIASSTITDPEVIALLNPLFSEEGTLPGTLEDIEETPVKAVPASAIVSSTTGATCVYDGTTQQPMVISSLGGGNSTILLAQEFDAPTVIANPAQLEGLAPCSE